MTSGERHLFFDGAWEAVPGQAWAYLPVTLAAKLGCIRKLADSRSAVKE